MLFGRNTLHKAIISPIQVMWKTFTNSISAYASSNFKISRLSDLLTLWYESFLPLNAFTFGSNFSEETFWGFPKCRITIRGCEFLTGQMILTKRWRAQIVCLYFVAVLLGCESLRDFI